MGSGDHAQPVVQIASEIIRRFFSKGNYTFNKSVLTEIADKAYGGTQAEGAYTPKDAYDALELAVNQYLLTEAKHWNEDDIQAVMRHMETLLTLMQGIPAQTNRTAEQERYQQFSTPPHIAYPAAWVAGVTSNDVVLEPSAGVGGLALFPKSWGAKVVVNELDPRRRGILQDMGFDEVTGEDARYIQNVSSLDHVTPTVVVMNPPFSSQATTGMAKNTGTSFEHVEAALEKLADGGRLVTILGAGRFYGTESQQFTTWIQKLKETYTVRANVVIDGSNYRKYGTTFNVRIMVIDKVGAHTGETVTGLFKDVTELPRALKGVRDARLQNHREVESNRDIQGDIQDPVQDTGRVRRSTGSRHPASASPVLPVGGEEQRDSASTFVLRTTSEATDAVQNPADVVRSGRDTGRGVEQPRVGVSDRGGASRLRDAGEAERRPHGHTVRHGVSDGGVLSDVGRDRGDRPAQSGQLLTDIEPTSVTTTKKKPAKVKDTGVFSDYVPPALPSVLRGLPKHPAILVESSAMASVDAPTATYIPSLPFELVNRGVWSAEQMVNIVYAGQAHNQMLPDGTRRGYLIGDGTGVGKGRQIAGIILDNMMQGRPRAVWISGTKSLFDDAVRDWTAVGGKPEDVMMYDRAKMPRFKEKNGIMFVTYDTLGRKPNAGSKDKEPNIDKLIAWLGEDFDGVIAFDESHNMANAVGKKGSQGATKPSDKATAGIELQRRLPKARIVYVSATAATEVSELAYAQRLGLWGEGTAFPDRTNFLENMSRAGTAGMELVARDMKAMGVYNARSITYEGVVYETLRHKLDRHQIEMYDMMSDAWQIIVQNMDEAMKITHADKDSRSRGRFSSALFSSMQRFYQQVLCCLSMPSVISDIQKELDAGHSCVLQIVNTNEAQDERTKAKGKSEDAELEELDFSPRNILIDYLTNAFPIYLYEEYEDDSGNIKSRPVKDARGNPVISKKAVEMRDDLIARINSLSIPDNPLDMLFRVFGVENVAEVTGRSSRVVPIMDDDGNIRLVDQKRGRGANAADIDDFQAGRKRILIFSDAGGTGKSYHADRGAKNQQLRIHYLLQPGWNATKAVQGFGRTHRSNQAQPPVYKLVTTDVAGQARFVSTIAKRLDNLGAMTKGQRQAGSGIFSAADNLESDLSLRHLQAFGRRSPTESLMAMIPAGPFN